MCLKLIVSEINCFLYTYTYTPVVVDNGHPLFYLFVARIYIYIGTFNSPRILRTVLLVHPKVLMYLRYLQRHEITISFNIYAVRRRGTAGMILVHIQYNIILQPCGTDEIIETFYQRYLLAIRMILCFKLEEKTLFYIIIVTLKPCEHLSAHNYYYYFGDGISGERHPITCFTAIYYYYYY